MALINISFMSIVVLYKALCWDEPVSLNTFMNTFESKWAVWKCQYQLTGRSHSPEEGLGNLRLNPSRWSCSTWNFSECKPTYTPARGPDGCGQKQHSNDFRKQSTWDEGFILQRKRKSYRSIVWVGFIKLILYSKPTQKWYSQWL